MYTVVYVTHFQSTEEIENYHCYRGVFAGD